MRASTSSFAAPLLALILAAPSPVAAENAPTFKIRLEHAGVYRVGFKDLQTAMPRLEPTASAELGMNRGGEPVPILLEDGDDGVFGPGDSLVFVAEGLQGEHTFHHRHSRFNVYWLDTRSAEPRRMDRVEAPPKRARPDAATSYQVNRHLEEDHLRLRFASVRKEDQEIWYWAKLTPIADEPFQVSLGLDGLDIESPQPVQVELAFRGWSKPRHKADDEMADHRIEVLVGDTIAATAEWDAQEARRVNLSEAPTRFTTTTGGHLGLRVPERSAGKNSLVDVSMLDWVKVTYPRNARVAPGQHLLELTGTNSDVRHLLTENAAELAVFGFGGSRLATRQFDSGEYRFRIPDGESRIWAVVDGAWGRPESIELDHPSDLAHTDQQADYLMITHPSLRSAIEPLADFHRERGLTVRVIEVTDVYDEFNAGVVHPRGIRDFLGHAWKSWQRPAPRFVLLVGDASWDPNRDRPDDASYADWTYGGREVNNFRKNVSTPYESGPANRDLIPTSGYGTLQGLAASDNWFVRLDGPDHYPEMAIGRLPVVELADAAAIVDKIIAYGQTPPPGQWRKRLLWIANEEKAVQARSDRLARLFKDTGFVSRKLYPQAGTVEASRKIDIRQAFDAGNLLVHFHGHGGRYIWRTGPADFTDKRDLFTLDDVEKLKPNGRLPVVLSMTCYSGPFDHPTADSIAEKFLRAPQRGAVAVLAASWRNDPTPNFSQALVEELTKPGTIGEAIVRAKRTLRIATEIELYNLLGDPALPIAVPDVEPTKTAAKEAAR